MRTLFLNKKHKNTSGVEIFLLQTFDPVNSRLFPMKYQDLKFRFIILHFTEYPMLYTDQLVVNLTKYQRLAKVAKQII